jgi:hypothetical protein
LYSIDSSFYNKPELDNTEAISPLRSKYRKGGNYKQKRFQVLNDHADPAQMMVSLSPTGFLQGPDSVELKDKFRGSPKKHLNNRNNKANDGVVISFLPQCKVPIKEMYIKMTLKNHYLNDIRVMDLMLTVNPKVIKFSIEIDTKARVSKFQDLPLVNLNNFDVTIQPMFEMIEGERSNFSLNLNKIKLKKKSKEMYRVQYCSEWINRSQARLTLINQQTNEKTIYNILGISGKPLSEDSISVVCNINETKTFYIPLINNTGKTIEYMVDCEIPNAKYETKITLKPSAKRNFPISFVRNISGEFPYVVKFVNKERKYIWFLVTINVEGSNIIEMKDKVCTVVR